MPTSQPDIQVGTEKVPGSQLNAKTAAQEDFAAQQHA
jgi:hypothetical protein